MGRGYFDDGVSVIGIEDHAFPACEWTGEPHVHERDWKSLGPRMLESGRGRFVVRVNCAAERHNRGDGEWYVYQKLLSFARSGEGTLALADDAGHHFTKASLWWIAGSGRMVSDTIAEYQLVFAGGEKERTAPAPAWDATKLQDPPAEYAGRSTVMSFDANGYRLGNLNGGGAALEIQMTRAFTFHALPPAYGLRIVDRKKGLNVMLTVNVPWAGDTHNDLIQTVADEILRNVTTGPVLLTGNGNTYTNCYLLGVRLEQREQRVQTIQVAFRQEVLA